MGINISQKTNYSALFSSLPTNKNSISSGFSLSDYATIKNGSYYKLMKAYYGKGTSSEVESIAQKGASADTPAMNSKIQSASDSLKKSADALLKTGDDSLFNKKDIKVKDENGVESTKSDYDRDAIANAISKFAKDYNGMIDAAKKSGNANVINSASNMVTQTVKMEKILSRVGITIEEDNKLTVDADKVKKADIGTLKSVFNGAGSFAYNVQSKASYMNMYSKGDAGKASGVYSQSATYSPAYNNGNIYNNYF